MALIDLITTSVTVAASVPAITTGYELPPEAAPEDARLPAVIGHPLRGVLTPGALEMHDHLWRLDVLVKRGDDLPAQYTQLLPLHEAIVAAFRTQTTLGLPDTWGVQIVEWEFGPASYLDASYLAILYTMRGKQKFSATYA